MIDYKARGKKRGDLLRWLVGNYPENMINYWSLEVPTTSDFAEECFHLYYKGFNIRSKFEANPYLKKSTIVVLQSYIKGVWMDLYITTDIYPPNQETTTNTIPDICAHTWASYTGLNQTFEYCTICDTKKD